MAGNRSRGRTVHFYNTLYPDDVLGGLLLNPSVTQHNIPRGSSFWRVVRICQKRVQS
ncbi:hypothetical protein V1520DRAFT_348407 [Lipomyces starkeyi]